MTRRSTVVSRPSLLDLPKRGCTDWPCLLIFVVLLILYILLAIFVFREGSLARFIYPTDTQGRICGTQSQKNRKFLQFFDILKCVKYVMIGSRCPTPQMCVEQCPSRFYHYKLLYAQELQLTDKSSANIEKIRSQLSCEKSAGSQVKNANISIYTLVKERKLCAPYVFPSAPFYGRCVPSVLVHALNLTINQANEIIANRGGQTADEDLIPSKDSMQMSFEYLKKALQIKRLLSFMIDDLIYSRFVLLLSLLAAGGILILYMILLRYFARIIIWLSIILCLLVFAFAAIFCFTVRVRMKNFDRQNKTIDDIREINITIEMNQPNFNLAESIVHLDWNDKLQSSMQKFDTAMILLDQFAPMSIVWLVIGITCCVICVILLICTCCLCDRLSLAAALIEEASKAICHALSVLIWPIVTFVLNLGVVIFGILVIGYYSTLGRPIYQISCSQDLGQSCRIESSRSFVFDNESMPMDFRAQPKTCLDFDEGQNCSPDEFAQLNCTTDRIRCVYVSYGFLDETFEHYFNAEWGHRLAQFLSERSWIVNLFNIFMVYWLLAFAVAFEEMVLACTFASYYWALDQMERKCCHGYFHRCLCLQGVSLTFRHHLGTIAFGSSIIAIIDTLRTIIDLIKDRMETMNMDNYGRCCLTLMNGCLSCVRGCFRFLSRYTYIMTAISGKWFCPSAFTATRLLLNNCLRVFVLDRVCAILLFIGRITITIGSCVFTAYLLDRVVTSSSLHFSWFPVLIIGILVYISSAIFLNVYSTATSALFFCVLYDLELHDDPQVESHVMSNRLRRILGQSKDFNREKFQTTNHSSINDQTQSQF